MVHIPPKAGRNHMVVSLDVQVIACARGTIFRLVQFMVALARNRLGSARPGGAMPMRQLVRFVLMLNMWLGMLDDDVCVHPVPCIF